jgi:hypothetical protein
MGLLHRPGKRPDPSGELLRREQRLARTWRDQWRQWPPSLRAVSFDADGMLLRRIVTVLSRCSTATAQLEEVHVANCREGDTAEATATFAGLAWLAALRRLAVSVQAPAVQADQMKAMRKSAALKAAAQAAPPRFQFAFSTGAALEEAPAAPTSPPWARELPQARGFPPPAAPQPRPGTGPAAAAAEQELAKAMRAAAASTDAIVTDAVVTALVQSFKDGCDRTGDASAKPLALALTLPQAAYVTGAVSWRVCEGLCRRVKGLTIDFA